MTTNTARTVDAMVSRTTSRLRPPPPTRPQRPRRRHQPTARKSASAASPAAPASTAPSSTATATCSNSVHAAEAQPPDHPRRRAHGHPRLTAGRPARRPATLHPPRRAHPTTRETPLPDYSANKPGANQDSAPPPTSTNSKQRIINLEQQVVDLRLQLEERDQDLAAARAANRELMTRLNASRPTG